MQEINLTSLKDKAFDVDPDLRFMALEDFRKCLTTPSSSGSGYDQHNRFSTRALEGFIPVLFRLLQDHNSDVQSQAVKSFEPLIGHLSNDSLLDVFGQLYKHVLEENVKYKNEKPNFKSFTTSIPNMALRSMLNSTQNSSDRNIGGNYANTRALEPTSSNTSFITAGNAPHQVKPHHPFDAKLSRAIVDLLVPQITIKPVNIDSIELLFDITKNLGYVLSYEDWKVLSQYLIDLSLKESGIISKRAIATFEVLCGYIQDNSIFSKSIATIKASKSQSASSSDIVRFQLYSVVFKSDAEIEEHLIDEVYEDVAKTLRLDEMTVEADDLDFDKLIELNLVREEGLNVLNDLINSNCSVEKFTSGLLDIIASFITFNPLNDDDDQDMEVDGDDEDIEFSDDEIEPNDYEENDGSWKLRSKACILLQSFVDRFPRSLDTIYNSLFDLIPLLDSNDLASTAAIKTAKHIVDRTSSRKEPHFSVLESRIVEKLLTEEKSSQIPQTLKLIESLNKFHSSKLIQGTFSKFSELDVNTAGSLDYLHLYKNVLKYVDANEVLPQSIINYITKDLLKSLNDKSFNIIIESIKIFIILLKSASAKNVNDNQILLLIENLLEKVQNFKLYSSELILSCINCLGTLITDDLTSEPARIIDALWNCVGHESTVKPTLEVLYHFYSSGSVEVADPDKVVAYVVSKLNRLILSSDDSISYLSLTLLRTLVKRISFSDEALQETVPNLIKSIGRGNKNNLQLSFEVLAYFTAKYDHFDTYFDEFINVSVQAVNAQLIDINNAPFFDLIRLIAKKRVNLFSQLINALKTNLEASAKVLAIVSIESSSFTEIESQEQRLVGILDGNVKEDLANLIFIVQFLGHTSEFIDLKYVNILHFFELLDTTKSRSYENDKRINPFEEDRAREAAATAIGLIVKKDTTDRLPLLLEKYSSNVLNNQYLITSFKLVLSRLDELQFESVWKTLWDHLFSLKFSHSISGELRNTGDLLSDIVVKDGNKLNEIFQRYSGASEVETNLTAVYTTIVIIKHLINKYGNSEGELKRLEQLLLMSIPWIDIKSIDIKQLIIGNLLTALHNKPVIILPNLNSSILPLLYNQLEAESDFKKIIPMGPYKYVIDEGLEIRKLSYEFIYTLISLDIQSINEYDINIKEIAKNIIKKGLVDEQNDIIVLSSINLINFINNHEGVFKELITEESGDLLNIIVNNLKLQLGKKLGAKASAQDTENYQERIKSIIKLTKKISSLIEVIQIENNVNYLTLVNNWNEFHNDVKTNFVLYYNSTESK
ncbi:TATA-binding protein-interacting protein [Scheffersomyces xylosifermentans]|uniref:TATA-binding protein-interacting protein n=1 Tax=Scheffersomyces xylosifermentans TaxID=1304137 RepID=UPI00315DC2E4